MGRLSKIHARGGERERLEGNAMRGQRLALVACPPNLVRVCILDFGHSFDANLQSSGSQKT